MSMEKENIDVSLSDLIKPKTEETPVKEKSPLEKMKEYKEKNPGLVVNNADVTYDNEKKVLKNSVENDRREEDFNGYIKEMDELIDAAKDVHVLRTPQNPIETAAMIDQLDRIAKEKANKPDEVLHDKYGNVITLPEDEKKGTEMKVPQGYNNEFFNTKTESEKTESDSNGEHTDIEIDEEAIKKEEEEAKEHERLVNILIDKTGFGTSHIDFTDEEKEKLSKATEIRVTEVESLDLETMVFDAPEESYVDMIESSSDNSMGTQTVPLVASRYRAKMRGLGYGQLGDLMLNGNEPTFEQYYKRFSTIYNNIVDTTIGKFESFEDFLKKTAFIDMNTLLYGLIVSTFPEVDSVMITCGKCGRQFEQKYFVRDLMDLTTASMEYLQKLDELMDCEPAKFNEFAENGPVRKRKYIKLPVSNYIVEIGLASAYDYLYQVISNTAGGKFREAHGDDVNNFLQLNARYLTMVRSVSIPNQKKEKSLIKYSSFEDIIQILYRIPIDDQQVLNGILGHYGQCYTFNFLLKNSKCPHCGYDSEYTDVDLNQLIFFKIGLLMTTGVNVENSLDL